MKEYIMTEGIQNDMNMNKAKYIFWKISKKEEKTSLARNNQRLWDFRSCWPVFKFVPSIKDGIYNEGRKLDRRKKHKIKQIAQNETKN